MKQYLLPFVGLSLFTTSSFAANDGTFNHQASLALGTIEWNDNQSDELVSLSYDYYFTPVKSDTPYALNGFLAQSSSLSASYNKAGGESQLWTAGGTWVVSGDWFLRGNYARTEENSLDFDIYNLGGGVFLNDSTELSLQYMRTESDKIMGNTLERDTWQAELRSYLKLASTQGIDANVSLRNSKASVSGDIALEGDDINELEVGADWYITKSLSLGAQINYFDFDNESEKLYSLAADYWLPLGDTFSLQAHIAREFEMEAWEAFLAVTARF